MNSTRQKWNANEKLHILIDESYILPAGDIKTYDFWNPLDWLQQVETAFPFWEKFSVGWAKHKVCGMTNNKR